VLKFLFTRKLHGTESFLRIKHFLTQLRNFSHFTESEGSIPHSQKPIHHLKYSLFNNHLNIILFCMLSSSK
jgi:hypothetical protein